mgnify:CR=1 FL=1
MKASFRRICSMAFALIMLFSVTLPTFALETAIHEDDSVIFDRVYEVCGGLPYHDLKANGVGDVYLADGSRYITSGAALVCENCSLVMVTEGDLWWNGIEGTDPVMSTIGKWAQTDNYGNVSISTVAIIIYIPKTYGYCGDSEMNGYRFSLRHPY